MDSRRADRNETGDIVGEDDLRSADPADAARGYTHRQNTHRMGSIVATMGEDRSPRRPRDPCRGRRRWIVLEEDNPNGSEREHGLFILYGIIFVYDTSHDDIHGSRDNDHCSPDPDDSQDCASKHDASTDPAAHHAGTGDDTPSDRDRDRDRGPGVAVCAARGSSRIFLLPTRRFWCQHHGHRDDLFRSLCQRDALHTAPLACRVADLPIIVPSGVAGTRTGRSRSDRFRPLRDSRRRPARRRDR